jgi:hypothetical protein
LSGTKTITGKTPQYFKPSDLLTWVSSSGSTIPQELTLHQNYPNPFNPTTVVSYQLSTASHVDLRIYDVLGREVAVLVNQEKTAGKYTATWNATSMPSGVYFYKLTTGVFSQMRQMVLTK